MTIVGNTDFFGTSALNMGIGSLVASLQASNAAAMGVGMTLVPPTLDTAAAMATLNQTTNFAQHGSMMTVAFEQMAEKVAVVEANVTAQQLIELATSVAATLV